MTSEVDLELLRAFWERKSHDARNRWTSEEMLAFELAYLRELKPRPRSILDVGSGHGELSRPLAGPDTHLVAVDFASGYARSFSAPLHHFVTSDVMDFRTDERFELILLVGVVTSLNEHDEQPLYRRMAGWLTDNGVAVVKNQCAVGEEFVFRGYSEDLATDYSGRYPRVESQLSRIKTAFGSVEPRPYPPEFNRWSTSAH